MGVSVSRVSNLLCGKKKLKLLMLGLHNAGKTTILYYLVLGEKIQAIPSSGNNVETIDYKNTSLTIWDMNSQCKLRVFWSHYYPGTNGVIFVVDSTDHDSLEEAEGVLKEVFYGNGLENAVFLVFANKQDLPEAMPISELTDKLQLQQVKDRKWHVQGVSGVNGMGLYDGLDWLCNEICIS